MDYENFILLINSLSDAYGIKPVVEHEFVYEFFEGGIPLFKLILSQLEDQSKSSIIASFHIELETTAAIQWFLRLRQLNPELLITGSYMKDAQGVTYVGEDAAILRIYMIEQEVISNWVSTEDSEEPPVVTKKPNPTKSFGDYASALKEFQKMHKKKGDISH